MPSVAVIDRLARKADTKPTEAQKEAGNYQKGHISLHGLDIAIENPRGSIRKGVNKKTGKKWQSRLPDHYGYIKRTEGADGDHVDTYVGRELKSDRAYIIDQIKDETGEFDEHKVMLGYPNAHKAIDAYKRAFSDGKGWGRIGGLTEMKIDDFKDWVKNGDAKVAGAKSLETFAEGGEVSDWVTPASAPAEDWVTPAEEKPSLVERAISPITSLPETYKGMVKESVEQMGHGTQQLKEGEYLKGAWNTAMGGLGYVSAPINAPLRTIIGKPVEDITGIPKEYTEFAAALAIPGYGLTKIPGREPPRVPPTIKGGTPKSAEEITTPPTPADTPFSPIAPAAPEFAGNINLSKINSPEDVKDVIRATAEKFEGFEEARRGVVTWEDVKDLAQAMPMTPEKLAGRMKGEAFNAEDLFAARTLLVDSATEVRNLAKAAEHGGDLDKAKAIQAIERHVAIQEQISGATAEAGRTLNQMKMLATASEDAKILRQVLAEGRGKKMEEIIRRVNMLDDPAQVSKFLGNATKASGWDMVVEAWKSALLSGPVTHSVNTISNLLTAMWTIPETAVAAGISKLTGSNAVKFGEVPARAFGLVEGVKDGLKLGTKSFLTEIPSDALMKIETSGWRSIPSMTLRRGKEKAKIGSFEIPLTGEIELGGKQARIPLRLLTAEDEFFRAIANRQEINSLAYRKAVDEGLQGRALAERIHELRINPTKDMIKAGDKAAAYQTFNAPVGEIGSAILRAKDKHPWLNFVAPFVRTPVNIVKFATERSPFAPLMKDVRENLKGVNGKAARDTQIARLTMGSAVGAMVASYAMDGTITGSGPTDPKERAVLFSDGWQPYSIKVGDKYYSYQRLEPLGMLFGVAADMAQLRDNIGDKGTEELAKLITASVSKNLMDKTWLRGVADVVKVLGDPDRYGENWIESLAGTMVPTGVAQFATSKDPYLREVRSVLDAIKNRVPGYKETLPMRRDTFGEPIKREEGFLPDLMNPVYVRTAKNDPVAREMLKAEYYPSKPARKLMEVELNGPQYERYTELAGKFFHLGAQQVLKNPRWATFSPDLKKDILRKINVETRKHARNELVAKDPELRKAIGDAKLLQMRQMTMEDAE